MSTKAWSSSNNFRNFTPINTVKRSNKDSNENLRSNSNDSLENTNKTCRSINSKSNQNGKNFLKNEIINLIKIRFYTEFGFFSLQNRNKNDSILEKDLDKKLIFYLEKYNLDNLLIEDSNKIIDEILINLHKHFFSEEKIDELKSSNLGFDMESKLKKYTIKENFKNLADELRSFKNTNLTNSRENQNIKSKPAMKYNQFQKSEKHELKFYEEFDYEKSKLKKCNDSKNKNRNFLDEIRSTKRKIENEIIDSIENKPKEDKNKDMLLREMLNNIKKDCK